MKKENFCKYIFLGICLDFIILFLTYQFAFIYHSLYGIMIGAVFSVIVMLIKYIVAIIVVYILLIRGFKYNIKLKKCLLYINISYIISHFLALLQSILHINTLKIYGSITVQNTIYSIVFSGVIIFLLYKNETTKKRCLCTIGVVIFLINLLL